ncbi:MAG: CPBP family intramembrane metalloprotease [Oscillospiraceae bacterium]|nr:CPBP family intramembrane metalloprotease [Oscillospiraceae bacterium]
MESVSVQEESQLNEFSEIIAENVDAVENSVNLELKQQEIKSFKQLLYLIAFTVMAVTGAQKVLIFLIDTGIEHYIASLPTVPVEESAAVEYTPISDAAWNFLYFINWFLSHLIIFLPALIIFGLAFRKKLTFEKTGEPYEFKMSWILPVFLASYALSYIASFISHLLAWVLQPVFGGDGLADVFGDVMPRTGGQLIIMLVMVGLIGPVFEELIYRHWLLRPLRRYGDFQAVIITALLFAFFHGNLTQFLYTFASGIIYGIVAVKTNSVKPVIILHIINNVYVILLAEFYRYTGELEELEGFAPTFLTLAFPWIIIGIGVFCFIYFLVRKYFKTENYNPHIPAAERVRIAAENPLVLIMFALLIAETIAGSRAGL